MPRLAVFWSGLHDDDEEANTSQEHELVHASIVRNEPTARSAEQLEESPFQEVDPVNGKHMAIYDLPDGQPIEDFDGRIRTALGEVPEHARLNTRCYHQFARWDGEYWRDDPRDVRMWCVVIWQPSSDVHEEFMDWVVNEFTPGMLDSPELLRTRMFELENASSIRNQQLEQVEKESLLQYMTIWEFENEDLPWEILIYLGSSEKWRHYVEGGYLKWQIAQYLVIEDSKMAGDNIAVERPRESWNDDDRNDRQNSSDDKGTDQEEDDSDPFEIR